MKMVHQANEIRRCARSKPKVADVLAVERIQNTERIVDVRHLFAEVITVVMPL